MLIDPVATPMAVDELRSMVFDLPRLSPDSQAGCPYTLEEVQSYAGDELAEFDTELRWVRTADIDDVHYWLWEMDQGKSHSFVYVEQYEDSVTLSSQLSNQLAPEAFLVREYLHNQYEATNERPQPPSRGVLE